MIKWKHLNFVYSFNLLFYLTFVAFITTFIYYVYDGGMTPNQLFLKSKCVQGLEAFNDDPVNVFNVFNEHSMKIVCGRLPTPYCDDQGILQYPNTVGQLWIIVSILLGILIAREAYQLSFSFSKYFSRVVNWLELTLIGLTSIMLFEGTHECNLETKRIVAALLILISWSVLYTMFLRHPKFTFLNVYFTMFAKVGWTFIKFLLCYGIFIVAFGIGFHILLSKEMKLNHANIVDVNETYTIHPRRGPMDPTANDSDTKFSYAKIVDVNKTYTMHPKYGSMDPTAIDLDTTMSTAKIVDVNETYTMHPKHGSTDPTANDSDTKFSYAKVVDVNKTYTMHPKHGGMDHTTNDSDTTYSHAKIVDVNKTNTMHQKDGDTDPTANDLDTKFSYYNNIGSSLFITFSMLVGELYLSDSPVDTPYGYLMFVATFVFVIVMVMMNLLNGLAVRDIREIKNKAKIYAYKTQVETLATYEAMLLGDPFRHLSKGRINRANRLLGYCLFLNSFEWIQTINKMFHNVFGKFSQRRFAPFVRKQIQKISCTRNNLLFSYHTNYGKDYSVVLYPNIYKMHLVKNGQSKMVYVPPELSLAAKEIAVKHKLNSQLKPKSLSESLRGIEAAIANIDVSVGKKLGCYEKKLMEIETRLMTTLKERKINYEQKKIETQLDQITTSLTQIDRNVQEMAQPTQEAKQRSSFDSEHALTTL